VNKPDAWMPLYVDDYLGAARELSCAESGAYFHLLLAAWTRAGSLPNDDAKLRRMAGATPREWPAIKAAIIQFFVVTADSWEQKRLRRELSVATERYEKLTSHQSARATRGWQKKKQKQRDDDAGGTAAACRGDAQPQPQEAKPPKPPTALTVVGGSRFPDFWAAWPARKRKVAKAKCRDVWNARRLDLLASEILAHVVAMAGTEQWREYDPSPLRYLNERRWEDGLPEEAPTASGKRRVIV
jgi:uncharacterized protein YdaU (DUF1376 family)